MQYALVDKNGKIVNMIVYDESEPHGPYIPPEGLTLKKVPDTAKIGDEGY